MAKKHTGTLAKVPSQYVEPRCNICNSSSRKHVERLLAASFSYVAVAEELQALDEDFKDKEIATIRKNVERHAKRHVSLKDRAVREIVERRAAEQGILVDEASGQIATGRAVLDQLVLRLHEQINDPGFRVYTKDGLEAIKMLEDMQRAEYVHEFERMQRQVWAISQALKEEESDPDKLRRIIARAEELFKNPTMEISMTPKAQELKK